MEEEDLLLGLAPASLPVQSEAEMEMALPSVSEAGGGEAGWSFEKALQAHNARGRSGSDDKRRTDSEGDDEEADHDDEGDESDDQDSENGDGNANEEVMFRDGAAASSSSRAADGGAGGNMSDDALLQISDKKAAKRLGKALYKRWKKLTKKSRKHKSSSKTKKDKKSSKEKAKKSKSSSSRKKKKALHDDDDDGDIIDLPIHMQDEMDDSEVGLLPPMDLSQAAADIEARLHKATLREAKLRSEKAMKKAAVRKSTSAETVAIAAELVASMAKARQLDDDIVHGRNTKPGAFPLHRVALKELVQARCRQEFMVGPLIEAGVLQELSYWLYDMERGEPAPYELRTTALDILLTFPLEGSMPMTDDLTQFIGVSRAHLIKTDLGRAVNAVRKHKDETVDNQSKCVQLLTSFSRVISGTMERDQTDDNKSNAVWKCQRDPTVASPFQALQTSSEALQKSFMKPDPRDPTSYNGLLPWRPPAATITNVSGTLNSFSKGESSARR